MGAVLATYVKDLFDLRRHEHDEAVLNSILGEDRSGGGGDGGAQARRG